MGLAAAAAVEGGNGETVASVGIFDCSWDIMFRNDDILCAVFQFNFLFEPETSSTAYLSYEALARVYILCSTRVRQNGNAYAMAGFG